MAAGSCSTGIIDAARTSDSRNSAPLPASPQQLPVGPAQSAPTQDDHPDRDADQREVPDQFEA